MLKGQTALITGAAKRIGHDIALALAKEGVNTVIHYNKSYKESVNLCKKIRNIGVKAWYVQGDFENIKETEKLLEKSLKISNEKITLLINNASIFLPSKFEDLTYNDLDRNIRINAWSAFTLIRSFSKIVKKGKIINLLDTRIKGYSSSFVAYKLSKRMLSDLTLISAIELAPDITVNAVAPGLILPPEGKDYEYIKKLSYNLPMKKHGSVKDVTDAVLFLLKSNFITGQIIYVDGGWHLQCGEPV